MRLELQITGEALTFGDLQDFVAEAKSRGVEDDEHLTEMRDERDDLEGFFLYVGPITE